MNNRLRPEAENYLRKRYGSGIKITDFEDKNLTYDIIVSDQNISHSIEYKQRYFETGKTDWALKLYDILVELIQTLPYFQLGNQKYPLKIGSLTNSLIDHYFTSKEINTAIGWFYKCCAERLMYFRYLDLKLFDIIDLDFNNFKNWVMNNIGMFKLQYSSKTTCTINLIINVKDIPKSYYLYTKIDKRKTDDQK